MAKAQPIFICGYCQKEWSRRMEYEEHMNSHTGAKPFGCDICAARFGRRSVLWNHKRIHSDEMLYRCLECGKEFKWKNSLTYHLDVHLRQKEAETKKSNVKNDVAKENKSIVIKPDPDQIEFRSPMVKKEISIDDLIDHVETENPKSTSDAVEKREEVSAEDLSKSLFLVRRMGPAPPYVPLQLPTVCHPYDFTGQ